MKRLSHNIFFWVLTIFITLSGVDKVLAQAISTDKNAIVHRHFRVETTNEADGNDVTKAAVTIQYMDGLGRPLQTIGYKQSPTQKDMVSGAVEFDKYGRVAKTALSAPATTQTGSYQNDPFSLANAYHADSYAYAATTGFDNSPLNRSREQYGAGQAWRTNNKKIQSFNESAGTDIRYYALDGSNNIILSGTYPANSLYKKRIIDEQGHTSIEITDKRGRLIQKQMQDNEDYITTYYLYDGLGRILAVIQPEGYKLNQSINKNSTEWNNWVFAYEYDYRGRQHLKKVPAAGEEYMIYDKWDRLVWSQTALQREQGKWTFYKYDAFNREIMRGEKTEGRSLSTLESEAHAWNYDRFESRVNAGPIYYSYSNAYPQIFSEADIRQVTYYDNYTDWRPNDMLFDGANAYHTQHPETQGSFTGSRSRNSENTNWMVSVSYFDSKERLIQTFSQNLYGNIERTDFKYNFAGEALEIRYLLRDASNNATIQLERFDYDHIGRKTAYKLGMNEVGETVCEYEYNEIGQLKTKKFYPNQTFTATGIQDYINRPPSPNSNIDDIARKAIFLNTGTVIDATAINKYSATIDPNAPAGVTIQGLQTIDLSYHLRGDLRGINLDGAGNPTPNASQGDLFSYKLEYETASQWNGNIGKQSWQTTNNNSPSGVRGYTFGYDVADRLTSANYTGLAGENYSLAYMGYDKNGNILNLQRYGKISGSASSPTFGLIDNLGYTYSGNRLQSVSDGVSGNHVVDLVPRGSGNYTYWTDGSLKSDENEQISNIIYDSYLKQPKEISLTDGRWIKYYYNGSGNLLKTLYSTSESWEFAGKIIYKNGIRYQISQQEGRLIYESSTWKPEFNYTDHLGNTRIAFRAGGGPSNGSQLEKLSETSFDPLGIVLAGINQVNSFQNRFEFQGKEKESTFALNRINLGARTYNPTIGRMDGVDALADHPNQIRFSPFSAFWNNPVMYTDPDGNCPSCPQGEEAAKVYAAGALVTNKDGAWTWTGKEWTGTEQRESSNVQNNVPDAADRWSGGNFGQRLGYGLADGVYSMFANNHLGGKQFESYDDKIKTKLGGLLTLGGPLLSGESAAANVADDIEKQILYHYTNEAGMNGIVNSGSLRPSLRALNPKDVRYGEGQYLSDIIPGTKTARQLSSSFIRVANPYKYTHYVGIDVTGLGVQMGRDAVYVVPNTKALDISKRIVSYGKN